MTATTTYDLNLDGIGRVPLTVVERGEGRAVLVLHGGAGPQSMAEFAELLAQGAHVRVLAPVHPGFAGTGRPAALDSVSELAKLYLTLLDNLDLVDVTVVGNSVGGWVAAEMALLHSARISRLVLLDPTGIEVPGHPAADVADMTLSEISRLSFHNAEPFLPEPAVSTSATRAVAAGNMTALRAYGTGRGADPRLRERLAQAALATSVFWGESDQIVDVDYGRAFAAAIRNASFTLLPDTGHMPQVETPEQVVTAVTDFMTTTAAWQHTYTRNTTVPPERIWATLRKLYTGTKLSGSGDDIVIHGPFAAGTPLSVTPSGADFVVECMITEVADNDSYAYRSNFNGLYLTSRHQLTRLPGGGTRITHRSEIAGPAAETVGPALGRRITEDRSETMNDLVNAAATDFRVI